MWKFSLHDSQASRYGPLEKLFGENDTLPLHSGVVNRAPYCRCGRAYPYGCIFVAVYVAA